MNINCVNYERKVIIKEKELSEFYNRRGKEGNSVYCKPCTNEQTLERQRALKKAAIEYKGGKCSVCSYSTYDGALDFHHVDPNEKEFSLSRAHTTSFNNIKEELDKCVLLCSNCHREVHGGILLLS